MKQPTNLGLTGLIGGVWTVPGVDQEPVIRLECWMVFRLDNGDQHLVGWNGASREGRVSSRVEAFDASTRQALTKTGRVYELCGRDGQNGDGLYVWQRWMQARGLEHVEDATQEFVRRIEETLQ